MGGHPSCALRGTGGGDSPTATFPELFAITLLHPFPSELDCFCMRLPSLPGKNQCVLVQHVKNKRTFIPRGMQFASFLSFLGFLLPMHIMLQGPTALETLTQLPHHLG